MISVFIWSSYYIYVYKYIVIYIYMYIYMHHEFPWHSQDIPMTFMATPWLPRISLLPETWFVQQLFNSDTLVAGSLHAPHEGRRPDGDGMDGPWLPCPTLEVSWLVTGLFRLPQTWPLATPRMSKIDRTTRDLEILQHPGLFFIIHLVPNPSTMAFFSSWIIQIKVPMAVAHPS